MNLGPQFNLEAHGQQSLFGPAPAPVSFLGTRWAGPKINPMPHISTHGGSYESGDKSSTQNFVQRVSEGRPAIRFPNRAAEGIVHDRRFKSQFETGMSMGTFSPRLRADYEKQAFGTQELQDEDRPVYGFISHSSDDESMQGASQYGGLKAILKPEVLKRTTVTHGDSLSGLPPVRAFDARTGRVTEHQSTLNGGMRYIEAQYHGQVHTSDIDHLEAEEGDWRSVTTAQDLGVPWRMRGEQRTHQPPLEPNSEEEVPKHGFWSNWRGDQPYGRAGEAGRLQTHTLHFTKFKSEDFDQRTQYPELRGPAAQPLPDGRYVGTRWIGT